VINSGVKKRKLLSNILLPFLRLLYHPIRLLSYIIFKTRFRLKILNKPKLPKPPYIVCSNHSSHLDGILVATVVRHRIRWLITKKHYLNAKMKLAYDALRLIPVDIGGTDFRSLKLSLKALKKGHVLGIFPEGTRSKNGKIKNEVHTGLAYLAIKAQVPVLTAAIKGSFEALPPGSSKPKPKPISITFGPVINPNEVVTKENINVLSDRIMSSIRNMYNDIPDR
jgi:1-acyl-sn-glycerol-3-phosphate acyltransferase